ncbi:hypothetical protein ANCCAN_15787 [Ancylostoma caninum]|uniref:Uncharacterized protein n=1 Tax=Ancylostoma caninum TaxID=29170 RepID=A0A368G6L1_ANCCA|nr:hypothetical protein ANCCAN_15787 [Ancylostoma caninum]
MKGFAILLALVVVAAAQFGVNSAIGANTRFANVNSGLNAGFQRPAYGGQGYYGNRGYYGNQGYYGNRGGWGQQGSVYGQQGYYGRGGWGQQGGFQGQYGGQQNYQGGGWGRPGGFSAGQSLGVSGARTGLGVASSLGAFGRK